MGKLKYDKLSKALQKEIEQDRKAGWMNPYRCDNEAVIRRNTSLTKQRFGVLPLFVTRKKYCIFRFITVMPTKRKYFPFITTTISPDVRYMSSWFPALREISAVF